MLAVLSIGTQGGLTLNERVAVCLCSFLAPLFPPKGVEVAISVLGKVSLYRGGFRVQPKIEGRTCVGPTRTSKVAANADLAKAQGSGSRTEYRRVLEELRTAATEQNQSNAILDDKAEMASRMEGEAPADDATEGAEGE
eukprot:9665057-Karenia_brevis.AAC.1